MSKRNFLKPKSLQGFTLVEILVVVILLGTIAALGLVRYSKLTEQRYARNARLNLMSIHSSLQIYLLSHTPASTPPTNPSDPFPSGASTTTAVNTALGLAIIDSNFSYAIQTNQAYAYRPSTPSERYFLGIFLDQPIASNNPYCTAGTTACPINNTPWEY